MNYPRIILILLCIAAAMLYARVLLPPEEQKPATEKLEANMQTKPELKPLPPEQMELVIQALAPEMAGQTQ